MRPHGYHGQHPAAATYHHPQLSQAHASPHFSYAHASIEASTPPVVFSSPCGLHNDHMWDTSSHSSESRESSTLSGGSPSSTTATNSRSTRPTRTKRGSESQGSGSDRSTKRPDSSKGELWCADCECAVADCSNPKVHTARVQNHEDLTQNALNISGYKIQQPNNKKTSGMLYDKKEILASTQIFLDEALQTIAGLGPEEYGNFIRKASTRIEYHIAHGSREQLPAGSLMSGPNGEGPCRHEISNVKCDTQIECRKSRRSVQMDKNLNNIMRSAATRTSQQGSAGCRSNSSTPRRH